MSGISPTSARRVGVGAWASLFALMLASLLVPYLLDKGYRIADGEVLLFSLAGVGFALPMGALASRMPGVARVSLAAFFTLLIDLYFTNGAWISLGCFALALGVLHSRFESNFTWMLGAFSLVFLSTALLAEPKPLLSPGLSSTDRLEHRVVTDLPPIIHLIFDEHGSPAALPESVAPAAAAGRFTDAYVERGFAVFTRTRSTSGSTQFSLGRLLALSEVSPAPGDNNFRSVSDGFSFEVMENEHVDALVSQGYRVEIIQSSFLELCDPAKARCHTYSRADHGHQMARFRGRLVDRLALALAQMHLDFSLADSVHELSAYRPISALLAHLPTKRNYWTRPAAMLTLLEGLERHLASAPLRGRAYVAHIMLPHFPYVFGAECELQPRQEWMVPDWTRGVEGSKADPQALLGAYWSQMKCLQSRSLRVVDAVLSNPEGRDAIFVIHGDHGVRLYGDARSPRPEEMASTTPQLALDAFFAVRAPGVPAGVDSTPDFLQPRFARAMRDGVDQAPPRELKDIERGDRP